MTFRPFEDEDRAGCLALLHSNTPEYFTPEDEGEFLGFLDANPGPYFVAEDQGRIVACGGWAEEKDGVPVMTWGIVHRELHGQGIGRQMLRFRLQCVQDAGSYQSVRLRTVQQVQGFFEKEGFAVTSVEPDGYGPGFDKVTMNKSTLRENST